MSATSLSQLVGFPAVPLLLLNDKEHRRQLAAGINRINQGKFKCTLDVALNPNTGATVIFDNRIGFKTAVEPAMAFDEAGRLALRYGLFFSGMSPQIGATSASITVHHTTQTFTPTLRFTILG